MSDSIGDAVDTANKIIDLLDKVMALVTGNSSFVKLGRHIKSEVKSMSNEFDILSRKYFDVILEFQGAIEKSESFDNFGDAICELRKNKYGLVFDRGKLSGKIRAFREFISDYEDHRARSLMKFLEDYSRDCDLFFYCCEYNGIRSESWATALAELARGQPNYTGVQIDVMGSFPVAKASILSGTEEALRQMASRRKDISYRATEISEIMRFRFW